MKFSDCSLMYLYIYSPLWKKQKHVKSIYNKKKFRAFSIVSKLFMTFKKMQCAAIAQGVLNPLVVGPLKNHYLPSVCSYSSRGAKAPGGWTSKNAVCSYSSRGTKAPSGWTSKKTTIYLQCAAIAQGVLVPLVVGPLKKPLFTFR